MGNDGGSIPTRRELVKSAARHPTHSQVRDTQAQTRQYRWTTCQLSKTPLSSPIVSDSLGRLYNKDSVIEWLLRGQEAFGDGEEVLEGRVKSLRDVVEVKFESLQEDTKADSENARAEQWVCPVSRKELGAGVKSVYIVPCGHVFAESAVKEVGGKEQGCLMCNKTYEQSDVIPINPEDSEIERLQERIKKLAENGLSHSLKKIPDKKSKKRKNGASKDDGVEGSSKVQKTKESGIRNSAAAALTSRVMEDEKMKHQQRKLEMSDSVKSLFTKQGNGKKIDGRNTDFMSRGYSLPEAQK
ncbi:Rtf2 RING-finger-domain-containing protein [Trichophaea hybrida]|nr:Rtf2 RING-finger-domain-containing protein [Trichophaea hybrida]